MVTKGSVLLLDSQNFLHAGWGVGVPSFNLKARGPPRIGWFFVNPPGFVLYYGCLEEIFSYATH